MALPAGFTLEACKALVARLESENQSLRELLDEMLDAGVDSHPSGRHYANGRPLGMSVEEWRKQQWRPAQEGRESQGQAAAAPGTRKRQRIDPPKWGHVQDVQEDDKNPHPEREME